jgi:hypothetical protein
MVVELETSERVNLIQFISRLKRRGWYWVGGGDCASETDRGWLCEYDVEIWLVLGIDPKCNSWNCDGGADICEAGDIDIEIAVIDSMVVIVYESAAKSRQGNHEVTMEFQEALGSLSDSVEEPVESSQSSAGRA